MMNFALRQFPRAAPSKFSQTLFLCDSHQATFLMLSYTSVHVIRIRFVCGCIGGTVKKVHQVLKTQILQQFFIVRWVSSSLFTVAHWVLWPRVVPCRAISVPLSFMYRVCRCKVFAQWKLDSLHVCSCVLGNLKRKRNEPKWLLAKFL